MVSTAVVLGVCDSQDEGTMLVQNIVSNYLPLNTVWTSQKIWIHKFWFFLQGLFESILCPEEHPLYFDSLISQLDKLMTCDYPTPESHGNLMSDQFQNLWVMSILREELELVQNLLLYVDSCELQLKSFLKLFKIILVRCLLDLKCSNIKRLRWSRVACCL